EAQAIGGEPRDAVSDAYAEDCVGVLLARTLKVAFGAEDGIAPLPQPAELNPADDTFQCLAIRRARAEKCCRGRYVRAAVAGIRPDVEAGPVVAPRHVDGRWRGCGREGICGKSNAGQHKQHARQQQPLHLTPPRTQLTPYADKSIQSNRLAGDIFATLKVE